MYLGFGIKHKNIPYKRITTLLERPAKDYLMMKDQKHKIINFYFTLV